MRTTLAGRVSLPAEVVRTLATDSQPNIRMPVARYPLTTVDVFLALAADSDRDVRHVVVAPTTLTATLIAVANRAVHH